MQVKKMIRLSMMVTFALVISLIEQMLPLPLPIPGMKLGLSNIVLLLTMIFFGWRSMLLIALLKSTLLMLLTGAVVSFWYSFCGALCACLFMGIIYRWFSPPFGLIGVSELGAFGHNLAQMSVAVLLFSNTGLYIYLPILTLIGLGSGLFVGLATFGIAKHLDQIWRRGDPYAVQNFME